MSQAGIQKLNELLQSNDEIGQSLADAISAGKAEGNLQAFIAMAKQHGCEISADEARAILQTATQAMSTVNDSTGGELSDDDLAQVAGGVGGMSPGPSVTNKSTLKITAESSQLGTTPEISTTEPINVSAEESVADDVLNMDDSDVADAVSGSLDQAADFLHEKSDEHSQSADEWGEATGDEDIPTVAIAQLLATNYSTTSDIEENAADKLDDASDGVKVADDNVDVVSPGEAADLIGSVDQHLGTDTESVLDGPTKTMSDSDHNQHVAELNEELAEQDVAEAEENLDDVQDAVDAAKSAADGVQDQARDAQNEVENRTQDTRDEAQEQWNNLTGNDDEDGGSDGGSDGDSDNDGIPDIIEDNNPFG